MKAGHWLSEQTEVSSPGNSGSVSYNLWAFISHQYSPSLAVQFSSVAQLSPTLCDPTDWAHQAPLSVGFSRQEHWSGLLCPPPGDPPDLGIEPVSPASPALQTDYHRATREAAACVYIPWFCVSFLVQEHLCTVTVGIPSDLWKQKLTCW